MAADGDAAKPDTSVIRSSHIVFWQELRGHVDKWEADVDAETRQRATAIVPAARANSNKSDLLNADLSIEHP